MEVYTMSDFDICRIAATWRAGSDAEVYAYAEVCNDKPRAGVIVAALATYNFIHEGVIGEFKRVAFSTQDRIIEAYRG